MPVKISTPGRICLFGEHQDYLNLPVIAAAISLRISINGNSSNDDKFVIHMPDIEEIETINKNSPVEYSSGHDYLRSSYKVLKDAGFTFSNGIECEILSEIPINAGTSSSSALVVSWINFLSCMSDQGKLLSPSEIAELAYRAEVLQFNEAGGMMDQYTTAIGGVLKIESFPTIKTKKYNTDLGAFVLGNSREPKDTQSVLSRVKGGVISIIEKLKKELVFFTLQKISLNELENLALYLTDKEYELLKGTILNRDITLNADNVLTSSEFNEKHFGKLLYEHHKILRDVQKISTPKINSMIEAALSAGALGAKINGSGGGGCMFAYAPYETGKVFEAVKRISGEAYIVNIDEGTRIQS